MIMNKSKEPKTAAQRMADQRQRRAATGIIQINLYADKRDHEFIKSFVAELAKKRITNQ